MTEPGEPRLRGDDASPRRRRRCGRRARGRRAWRRGGCASARACPRRRCVSGPMTTSSSMNDAAELRDVRAPRRRRRCAQPKPGWPMTAPAPMVTRAPMTTREPMTARRARSSSRRPRRGRTSVDERAGRGPRPGPRGVRVDPRRAGALEARRASASTSEQRRPARRRLARGAHEAWTRARGARSPCPAAVTGTRRAGACSASPTTRPP